MQAQPKVEKTVDAEEEKLPAQSTLNPVVVPVDAGMTSRMTSPRGSQPMTQSLQHNNNLQLPWQNNVSVNVEEVEKRKKPTK